MSSNASQSGGGAAAGAMTDEQAATMAAREFMKSRMTLPLFTAEHADVYLEAVVELIASFLPAGHALNEGVRQAIMGDRAVGMHVVATLAASAEDDCRSYFRQLGPSVMALTTLDARIRADFSGTSGGPERGALKLVQTTQGKSDLETYIARFREALASSNTPVGASQGAGRWEAYASRLLCALFTAGLGDRRVQEHVVLGKPQRLTEAFDLARTKDLALRPGQGTFRERRDPGAGSTGRAPRGGAGEGSPPGGGRRGRQPPPTGAGEPRRSGRLQGRPPAGCFECGDLGHFAKDCPRRGGSGRSATDRPNRGGAAGRA